MSTSSARKRKSAPAVTSADIASPGPRRAKKNRQYVVEKIVSKRLRKGEREFLIRWEGYDSDSDTWEPEANLSTELITEFLIQEEQFKAQPRTTRHGGHREEPPKTATPKKRARSQKTDSSTDATPSKRITRTPSRSTSSTTTTTTSYPKYDDDQGIILAPSHATTRVASHKKNVRQTSPKVEARPAPSLISRPTAITRSYEHTITTVTHSPQTHTQTYTTTHTSTSNSSDSSSTSNKTHTKYPNPVYTSTTTTSTHTSTPLQLNAGLIIPSLVIASMIAILIHLIIGVSLCPSIAKLVVDQLEKIVNPSLAFKIFERIHFHDHKILIAVLIPLYVFMHLIVRIRSRSIHHSDYTVGPITGHGIPDTHWTSPRYNYRADRWASEVIRAIYGFITMIWVVMCWKKNPSWGTEQDLQSAFFGITGSFAITDILLNHPTQHFPRILHSLITSFITLYLIQNHIEIHLYQYIFYVFLLLVLAESERAGSVAFGGLLHPLTSYVYQILYILGTPLLGAYFFTHDSKHPIEASLATGLLVTQAFISIIDTYMTH